MVGPAGGHGHRRHLIDQTTRYLSPDMLLRFALAVDGCLLMGDSDGARDAALELCQMVALALMAGR